MNNFRDRLGSGKPQGGPLLRPKQPRRSAPSRAAEDESFAELSIEREEMRLANHRDCDRHRLDNQQVEIVVAGRRQTVGLVNLSGGGAMIEGAEGLQLWERVELCLGGGHRVAAAVRWLRGQRHGLEFAQETRIEAEGDDLAAILRAVIARSFPDGAAPSCEATNAPTSPTERSTPQDTGEEPEPVEREYRLPLIWSGQIHFDYESQRVRLRNISSRGALIECGFPLQVGAELLLDLDEAGTIFATVIWAHGDAAGLSFESAFDLQKLVAARPQVAVSRWVAPDYLRDVPQGNSPWRSQWGVNDRGSPRRLGAMRRC